MVLELKRVTRFKRFVKKPQKALGTRLLKRFGYKVSGLLRVP